MTTRTIARVYLSALLCLGCGDRGSKAPAEVFTRALTAAHNDSWAEFLDCVAPDQREAYLFYVYFMGSFVDTPAFKAELAALAGKHGFRPGIGGDVILGDLSSLVKLQELGRREFAGLPLEAILTGYMVLLKRHGRFDPTKRKNTVLSAVSVQGTQASGRVAEAQISFEQHDGEWTLDALSAVALGLDGFR